MSVRWWTSGVWALAAGGALFWGFKVFVKPLPAPAHTQVAAAAAPVRGDLTRLLGNDPPPPAAAAEPEVLADARFQLVGVVSPRQRQAAREGLALIAVDGKPARAYRVGAVVEGEHVLQSVAARGVTLGPRNGPAVVALNLAPPAPPATGTLPGLGTGSAPGAAGMPGVRRPGMPPNAPPRRAGQPSPETEAQESVGMPNQVDTQPLR